MIFFLQSFFFYFLLLQSSLSSIHHPILPLPFHRSPSPCPLPSSSYTSLWTRNFHLGHCLRNQSVRVLRATGRGDITRPGDRDWGFSFPVWQSWQVAFSCPFILHFLISPCRFILCVLLFSSFVYLCFFLYIFILPVFIFLSFARLSFLVFSCLPFRHLFTFPFFVFFFRALCPPFFLSWPFFPLLIS